MVLAKATEAAAHIHSDLSLEEMDRREKAIYILHERIGQLVGQLSSHATQLGFPFDSTPVAITNMVTMGYIASALPKELAPTQDAATFTQRAAQFFTLFDNGPTPEISAALLAKGHEGRIYKHRNGYRFTYLGATKSRQTGLWEDYWRARYNGASPPQFQCADGPAGRHGQRQISENRGRAIYPQPQHIQRLALLLGQACSHAQHAARIYRELCDC
ncbi:hypothetical protein [Candidatus Nitrotoga fabula]|uniref:Uncharacterized protein n=1 Tax=Candidatus Nitrotoga fabula TaxID=2182327 RepID=A0A916FBM0_9PROT|nr:hypothetical protein [Candidatus Nitrotoga fabula]CAE6733314.1 hypothetical protein NTGZN8_60004 [Candidatus Nitrotoga fabula]